MNDTAAHLVDRVLPQVAVRQWVLSLPHKYRFLIAKDAQLLQKVLGIFVSVVFGLLIQASGEPSGAAAAGGEVSVRRRRRF